MTPGSTGELAPGRSDAFAIAVAKPGGGGRYLVLGTGDEPVLLTSYAGDPDLSCYSPAEAQNLDTSIRRSDTIHGGLAGGFTNSAAQLTELSTDLGIIGNSLNSNRNDAVMVATSLDGLGASLDKLRDAVASGPHLDQATKALDTVRMGILALLIWLGVLAVGAILAGVGCWVVARGPGGSATA